MDLFGHTTPKKGDLVRCRHRVFKESPAYYTEISLGIVLWRKEDYFKICLQNGRFVLAHKGDIEVGVRDKNEK